MTKKIVKGYEQEAPSLKSSQGALDAKGREIPDGRPMEPPVGYKPSPSLIEQIRAMVRDAQLQKELEEAGAETFEEADDFDIGDDYDPTSPYELEFEPPVIARPEAPQGPTPAPEGPVTGAPAGGATGGGEKTGP